MNFTSHVIYYLEETSFFITFETLIILCSSMDHFKGTVSLQVLENTYSTYWNMIKQNFLLAEQAFFASKSIF